LFQVYVTVARMTDSSAVLGQERAAVAQACRRLGAAGLLIGTAGNVSARVGDRVAITATGAILADLTPDEVTVIDLDGKIVAGTLEPTSELDLHLGIYRRYAAGAVVHTHAPMATALSCVLDELPCIHYQLLALGGAVRVAPYATFGTPELADSVLTALEGRSAALMANHGALTHAPTLAKAVEHALLLEWACGVYQHAAAIGVPRALDEEQQRAVIEAALARNYGTTHAVPPVQEGNR
jgi:L-fuculose-phosphate aldolase